MKIAFRTDASIQIGTGHVMRCLTLADELRRQGHECVFLCREHEGHLGDLISQKGFKLHLLAKTDSRKKPGTSEPELAHADWLGGSWQKDAKETSDLLHDQQLDWLVVDHYALDARWERMVSREVGQVMVIDDLADREHECAVLLDQNLGRQPCDYDSLVPSYCNKLIGPQYALLRPEFSEIRPESLARRQSPKLECILISLGGVDRTNVTGQVLEALAESDLPSTVELDIVVGATAPCLEGIQRQAAELRFPATVSVGVDDMAERMCRADLAIGAAGSTSWERCCLGLPCVLVILAANQSSIGSALQRSGSAVTIDTNDMEDKIGDLISQLFIKPSLLTDVSERAQKICDGNGCARVTTAMDWQV